MYVFFPWSQLTKNSSLLVTTTIVLTVNAKICVKVEAVIYFALTLFLSLNFIYTL